MFGDIRDIVGTPDGGVIVWDATFVALREYDGNGEFVRQIGREGAGPGEYQSAAGLRLLSGQRLVFWDAQQRRLQLYDSAGLARSTWRGPHGAWRARPSV